MTFLTKLLSAIVSIFMALGLLTIFVTLVGGSYDALIFARLMMPIVAGLIYVLFTRYYLPKSMKK